MYNNRGKRTAYAAVALSAVESKHSITTQIGNYMTIRNRTLRERYDSYYLPRAQSFVREISDFDVSGIPEPHLPLWGRSYEDSPTRIGIIGRDTRHWGDMNDFVQAVNVNPKDAIHRNKEEFDLLEFTGWTNNFGTTFWDTSMKILAEMHGISDWKRLKRREEELPLSRFFWANVNSVERFEVSPQENHVLWETWRKVKDASERYLDSFKALLEMFKPDVVFLMNWEPGDHFLDFEIHWYDFGDHQAYAHDALSNTHILATAHPTWLNRNGLYDKAISGIIGKAKQVLEAAKMKGAGD
jgi:hypothetical protein